jgi:hypothetical protein
LSPRATRLKTRAPPTRTQNGSEGTFMTDVFYREAGTRPGVV